MGNMQLTFLNFRRTMLCQGIRYKGAGQRRSQVHTTPHDAIHDLSVPSRSSPTIMVDLPDSLGCLGSTFSDPGHLALAQTERSR